MTCLLMKTYFQQIKLRKKRTFIHYEKENILALVKLDISYHMEKVKYIFR